MDPNKSFWINTRDVYTEKHALWPPLVFGYLWKTLALELQLVNNFWEGISSGYLRLSSLQEDRSKTRRRRCDVGEWEGGRAETDVTCFSKRWVFSPHRCVGSDYGTGRSSLRWETRANKVEVAWRQFTEGKEELSSRSELIGCWRLNKRQRLLGAVCSVAFHEDYLYCN